VIGIVASRLVERFHRPVVLVAGSDDGAWTGSGRSIPAFDLYAALAACAGHLERSGGHRAAAGLAVQPDRIDAFAAAFAAYAGQLLGDDDLRPTLAVDAVVNGRELTLDLCEELEHLAPFGLGNPGVTLLAVDCGLSEVAAVGEGKHVRFAVTADGARSAAIAFGEGERLDRYRQPGSWDVAFRLAANRWNGTVAPQLVVKRLFATHPEYASLRRRLAEEWRAGEGAWSEEARSVFAELGLLEDADGRRHLVESETFRALLAEGPSRLARAA
jgi:single-stranded-DNA-specific exonuclease